jgi:basic membrane protein A
MMKNVDNSLFRAVDLHIKGELPYGQAERLGIALGGVGLAINDIYEDSTPENILDLIDAVMEAVDAEEVGIVTVFGDEPATVGMGCDAMPTTDFDVTEFLGE